MDSYAPVDLTKYEILCVVDFESRVIVMLEEFASELGLNRLKVLYQPESQVFKGITLPGDISKTVIKLNSKPHTLYIRPKTKPPYVDNSMFKRVEKILNSIGEGITICDANLRHVFSNARFGEMTGLDKDAQGVSILEHYPGSISDTCVSVEVVRTRKQYTSINTYNNGVSLLSTGVPVFDDDGNLQYVVTISRNITELVRQEASVHGKQQNKTPMTVQKFISNAANIRFAIQHMDKLIGQRLSVLLLGETGTGKDYFAKFLHENAYPDPENRPFIKINCGAIPESLLESELFGYEKGAFTGASAKGKKGLIELANNGTLFLDEIGELPYNLQAKLLGVLQDKELTRVGGSEKIKINAKIISASNRDIFKMTQENKFRLDLYYRISMVTLHIPPLRERREDIPYLIDQLLREINQLYGKNAYLSLELYDLFFKYDWPGNIRELKNLMEKLIIFSSGDRIGIDDLRVAEKFLGHSETRILDLLPAEGKESRPRGLKEMVAAYEKNIIETALRDKRTLQEAAQYLGIDISTLVRKKSKYSI